jgi:hypothetical protein
MSLPLPYEEALQYFRHGHLFQITRDGEWVAGCVSYQHQGQLLAELSGIKDADPKLIKEGAFTAIYYVAIQWANENGYRAVNFLGTVPYMSTGIFFHKRKWGARISVPLYLQTRLWMKISRPGPGVRRFLVDHPCIVFDRDESLCGLIFVDDPDNVPAQSAEEWDKLYATPGLNRLVVQSVNDFANQSGRGNYAGSDQPVPSLL